MRTVRAGLAAMLVLIATFLAAAPAAAQDDGARMYNTAKQKLMSGEGIVGVSVSSPDPDSYCAAANAGFDFHPGSRCSTARSPSRTSPG